MPLLDYVTSLIRNFQHHTEKDNLSRTGSQLDEAVLAHQGKLETMLILDADRTLAAEDTGKLFWDCAKDFLSQSGGSSWPFTEEYPLKNLFSSPLGYSHTAFRQAVLLYEEVTDEQKFEDLCVMAEVQVKMYPEMISLLKKVAETEHVGAVVVTCGLRRVWEKVLARNGLSHVKVIGGGNLADNLIVTAEIKAALVTRSQKVHQLFAWAFGDSPLDLEMLKKANQAIIVVGEESTRSKTMDIALLNAIDSEGFKARQVVLPNSAKPRLETTKLPLVQLSDQDLINSIFARRDLYSAIQVLHATNRGAAKLLMTPMRDATISGPALREAHRHVGWYLATEFLPEVIGLEDYPIQHVQGHTTTGHQLLHEKQTTIVALMRGGEPMALGVSDAFPRAMFIHASYPGDLMLHHLQGQMTVILVDSVMNSGKTAMEFVQRIRKLYADIRIVVVAGVAQAQSVSEGSLLAQTLGRANVCVVALRLSDNKFTGTGTTDTGNRLFNTTHLA
jgi:uracil phosphoribosyltransferase